MKTKEKIINGDLTPKKIEGGGARKGSLKGKLLAVEPEYRFAVYKKLLIKKAKKKSSTKGSPVLSGSFENGRRR